MLGQALTRPCTSGDVFSKWNGLCMDYVTARAVRVPPSQAQLSSVVSRVSLRDPRRECCFCGNLSREVGLRRALQGHVYPSLRSQVLHHAAIVTFNLAIGYSKSNRSCSNLTLYQDSGSQIKWYKSSPKTPYLHIRILLLHV